MSSLVAGIKEVQVLVEEDMVSEGGSDFHFAMIVVTGNQERHMINHQCTLVRGKPSLSTISATSPNISTERSV